MRLQSLTHALGMTLVVGDALVAAIVRNAMTSGKSCSKAFKTTQNKP